MQLLTDDKLKDYEEFLQKCPKGHFAQTIQWAKLKDMWKNEVVLSLDSNGNIKGSMSLLIRKIPFFNSTIMYSPRGPVCDIYDKETIKELVDGAKELAKKHKSYVLKIDPDVEITDEKFKNIMAQCGFKTKTSKNFEGIQPNFVFRKTISGMTEQEVFDSFHSKHRYNVRLAIKKGCSVKIGKKEDLKEFVDIMMQTGVRDGFVPRSLEYFEKMYDALGDMMRLYLVYYDNKVISGAISILYGNKVWYLYGASSNEYRNVMPNYLMQWEMIKWAIEEKCDIYDFRGVSGDLDESNPMYGLYRFKKGFNGDLVEFVGALDYVFNPFMYFVVEKGEKTYRELRRKLFLKKNKSGGKNESFGSGEK